MLTSATVHLHCKWYNATSGDLRHFESKEVDLHTPCLGPLQLTFYWSLSQHATHQAGDLAEIQNTFIFSILIPQETSQ